jgi:hypothetical protein
VLTPFAALYVTATFALGVPEARALWARTLSRVAGGRA